MNSISSSANLASIMSRLYNQAFLLLTELPQMVTVLATNYQLEHNCPSYTGNIHDVLSSVDFLYCMPLGNALQILFGENTQSFLLTIQCNKVAIYCMMALRDLGYWTLMLVTYQVAPILKYLRTPRC